MTLLDNLSNYRTILYGGDNNVPKFGVQNQQQNNSLFNANQLSPSANSATIPQTQQIQPAQATAPSTSDVPATNNQNSLTNAIDNLKNAQGNLNNYKNNTQLLNSQDLAKNTLPVLPDRNQFDNTSLLKFENVKPENWTPQQWGWLGDVYAAKTAYETHTKNIDWYNNQLARTDLSDADRQKYTDARDTAMQLRENAMNSGAMTRRTALANGFDIDALGMSALGDSLGATTQALDYFQQRNQQSLLKLPTPRAFNRQRRDELKKEGYNPFHALVLANEETKDYVDDASNKLLWAMQMNGTTDGVINNNGVGYLKQLLKIDPASANMFAQEYASPAQGFAAQNQTLNNILNNDNALQRLLLNIAAQDRHQDKDIAKSFGLLTQQQTWQGDQNNANRDLQKYKIDLDDNYRNATLNLKEAAEIAKDNRERLKLWQESYAGKSFAADYFAKLYFPDDPEKQNEYRASYINPRYSTDKERTDTAREIKNRLNSLSKDFINGNKDALKEKLESLKADFIKPEGNYMKKLEESEYNQNGLILELYDNYLNKNISMWDVYDQTFRLRTGRNPNTNENGDPEWLLEMPQKEREEFLNACAKERGYRKPTPTDNQETIHNPSSSNYGYTYGTRVPEYGYTYGLTQK